MSTAFGTAITCIALSAATEAPIRAAAGAPVDPAAANSTPAEAEAMEGGEANARMVLRFDTAFLTVDSLIFSAGARRDGTPPASSLHTFTPNTTPPIPPALDAALRAHTAAVVSEGNGKTGLQLTGQTYWRISGNGGYEDETGEGHYRAKFQAELRWYLLQSSLFGKEGRRREAAIREEIERAGYEKERTDISDFRLKDAIAHHYDSLLSGLLQRRLTLLRLLDDAQGYLLSREDISSDRTLRALEARMDAERRLATIEGTYPPAASLASAPATVITVDSAALVSHAADTHGDMKLARLRMELLEQQAQNDKWWQPLRVAPFIRYAHYFRSGLHDTDNVDAGLTFTLPLDPEYLRRRRTRRAQAGVLGAETERLSRRVADKTALVVEEIGRLNRASRSEAARVAELRDYIARRTDAYRRSLGTHNRIARAQEYAMYIASLERLTETQYRRDCLLADLQALLPGESVLRFCRISQISN